MCVSGTVTPFAYRAGFVGFIVSRKLAAAANGSGWRLASPFGGRKVARGEYSLWCCRA